MNFNVFGVQERPRQPQKAQESFQEAPEEPQNLKQKGIQKWTSILHIVGPTLEQFWGPFWDPTFLKKGTKNGTCFGSNFGVILGLSGAVLGVIWRSECVQVANSAQAQGLGGERGGLLSLYILLIELLRILVLCLLRSTEAHRPASTRFEAQGLGGYLGRWLTSWR